MTTTAPPQPLVRTKLSVDILEARNLLPKDGQGSSSPYVIVDFDGQKKRTSTKLKDLNPVWNETLVFEVSDPENLESEELEIEVFTDRKGSGSAGAKKRQSLGKLKLYGNLFAQRGEEGLVYFSLQKKSVFSYIRGDIGLKIYYYSELIEGEEAKQLSDTAAELGNFHVFIEEALNLDEKSSPYENAPKEPSLPAAVEIDDESTTPPVVGMVHSEAEDEVESIELEEQPRPEVRTMHAISKGSRSRVSKKSSGNYMPKVIPGRFNGSKERSSSEPYNLVDSMQYLFVRIVKARNLPQIDGPYVKIKTDAHCLKSKPASYRFRSSDPEWKQVFAIPHNRNESIATLEITVWGAPPSEPFLGGVCFDVSDAPVRDPPDSPLATRWYTLEGVDGISGDIQLAVWVGTQTDEAFPESSSSNVPNPDHTRPKVYQSPKLWYLRITIVEAQDLRINASKHSPSSSPDIRVKGQLGFQVRRTRRGSMANQRTSSFLWFEDFFFVAAEPLEERLILVIEDLSLGKDPGFLGRVSIPLASIEQRLDERHIPSKWHGLGGSKGSSSSYIGRINLRLCLEGGYHVLDEAAHMCSDYLPTAKQLWRPPVGILELGILGAHGLLPMKTTRGSRNSSHGKGSTDSFCVAKYGMKWVRTKTVNDTFDPKWNEQYTWQVYDPCTVLTIGVFDNCRMFTDVSDHRIGKVRIRISALESNKVYLSSYPLLVLTRTGLRKMGEIELAVRFSCPSLLLETLTVYGQPLLPRLHYLKPLGVAQTEALRTAAIKMVGSYLAKSEPPLGTEVVRYMLDADSHSWSMRKSKVNWFRIVSVLGWAVGFAKWLDDIRTWKNQITTILVHFLYLVLVWYPDLIAPTGFLYVILMGIWYYRFRPKIPAGMDTQLSHAESIDPDELDEEFDTIPSSKSPEIIRARYDRLRVLAGRIQTVLGDVATQGERVQALVSWRDPRATKVFIAVCLVVTVLLYSVPTKMVAVAMGFYFLRHPMFRDPMPAASLNFFRRLPSKTDLLM